MTLKDTPEDKNSSLASLVAQHRDFVAFVLKRVGDAVLAEDIVQEAFARGVSRIADVRSDGKVSAWFYKSLRNAVVDRYRRAGARSRALHAFAEEMQLAAKPSPEYTKLACQCVLRMAEMLKPTYRDILVAIEIDDHPVAQYAALHGLTPSAAGVRLFRARAALRKQVSMACGTCAECDKHGCNPCTCQTG